MRLFLASLAFCAMLIAVACRNSRTVLSSQVASDGTGGFVLQNYVPLEGGKVVWAKTDTPFAITLLGHWPCKLDPPSGVGDTVTCDVGKADDWQVWPYEISSPLTHQATGAAGPGAPPSTVAFMHVGPCQNCMSLGGGGTPPPTALAFSKNVYPIYCDQENGPATVKPTTITASSGSKIVWQPSGTQPTATIDFGGKSPCREGTPIKGAQPTCTVGATSSNFPYTVTQATGCSASAAGSLQISLGNSQ